MNPIELVRYDKSIKEHGELLWKVYKDEKYGEFFRRMPKTWVLSDVLNFEEVTGSQLFLCQVGGQENVGLAVISSVCWYGLNAHVGLILLEEYQDETRNGRKLAFWAILAFARLFFDKMNLKKMSFLFLKSRRDLEKGFVRGGLRKEGEFLKNVLYEGLMEDELMYCLDKETYDIIYKG